MATGLKVGTTGTGDVMFGGWRNADGTENYKCRAWVNFNGTGTVAIRASGNVSSITDNGTGYYRVNFTTAMPDTNYAVGIIGSGGRDGTTHAFPVLGDGVTVVGTVTSMAAPTTTAFELKFVNPLNGAVVADQVIVGVSVFR